MVDRRTLKDGSMMAVNLLAFALNAASHVVSKSELQKEGCELSAFEYIAAASISLICMLNIVRDGVNIHKRYCNHPPDNPYAPVRPDQDIPPRYVEEGRLPSYNDAMRRDSNNQVQRSGEFQSSSSSQSDGHARSAPEPNDNESDVFGQLDKRPRSNSISSVSSKISFKSNESFPDLPW